MTPRKTDNQEQQQRERRDAPSRPAAPPSDSSDDEAPAARVHDHDPQRGQAPRWKTITDPPPV